MVIIGTNLIIFFNSQLLGCFTETCLLQGFGKIIPKVQLRKMNSTRTSIHNSVVCNLRISSPNITNAWITGIEMNPDYSNPNSNFVRYLSN